MIPAQTVFRVLPLTGDAYEMGDTRRRPARPARINKRASVHGNVSFDESLAKHVCELEY